MSSVQTEQRGKEDIPLDSPRTLETVLALADEIRSRTKYSPSIGIICGSGLGKIAALVKDPEVIAYSSIPGFPRSTVPGHHGNLVIGKLDIQVPDGYRDKGVNNEVIVMQGRCHSYEGYSHWHASLPIRAMQQLGVRILVLTSAVGSLKDGIKPGDIVVLRDHLNLPAFGGRNPIFGMRDPRLGPRVLPVDNMYDREIRKLALQSASELGFGGKMHVGSLGVGTGPTFEGVAESKWFHTQGLDVMGMSTAHEAIQARHCGMKVVTFAVVSNAIATSYDVNAFNNESESHGGEKDEEHLSVLATCVRAGEYLTPIILNTMQKVVHHPELFELTTYEDGWWKE